MSFLCYNISESLIEDKTMETRKIAYEETSTGCHVCTSHSRDGDGYPRIFNKGKRYRMGRYIYMQNFGAIPKGLVVRHTCDNPSCINPSHLRLGTVADNYRVLGGSPARGVHWYGFIPKLGHGRLSYRCPRQQGKVEQNRRSLYLY